MSCCTYWRLPISIYSIDTLLLNDIPFRRAALPFGKGALECRKRVLWFTEKHALSKRNIQFLAEHYKGDFSDFIRETMESEEAVKVDDVGLFLDEAYREGFADGIRLAVFAAAI